VPDAARKVAEDSIQLHGGIGATWDYQLNGYLRRIMRIGASIGAPDKHRRRLAETLLVNETPASSAFHAAAE
jgi:alkylation response protein AidB-like acyl-CoA dehydrogenase